MNIVVANSVGIDRAGYHMVHVPSRWSLGVKNFTNCGYYPWQLAYTSALLKRETPHRVKFLDGVLNGWDHDAYLAALENERPDWLIFESSTRTIHADLRLAAAAKEKWGTRLVFTGQHPMAKPEEVLEVADHVLIGEYEFTVLELIRGRDPKTLPGVYPNARGELIDVDALPFPEDEDVRRLDYHEPNCRYRQIQMYASRGCPRRCNFCAAATLYYDELNWRPRNIDSVVEEIRTLRDKYPEMEGVFFDEEVHNIKKSFNIGLARAIRAAGLDDLKYEALCEYVSLDEEALKEMVQAGYYKIRFGVETGSDRVADKMTLGKKHDLKKLRSILKFGKRLGLTFYATFSMGGLGSDRREDRKTVDLIHELTSQGLLDEVQVSINTPQPGTDFYESCVDASYLTEQAGWQDFDGNGHVVVDYPHYPAQEIKSMFDAALDAFDKGKLKAASMGASYADTDTPLRRSLRSGATVLLLRSARTWMIQQIVAALPDIMLDVLGQETVAREIGDLSGVREYLSYGAGFFAIERIDDALLDTLRRRRYDCVLLPMANNHLPGYQNVLEVAQHLQPRRILGVLPEGGVQELTLRPEAKTAL